MPTASIPPSSASWVAQTGSSDRLANGMKHVSTERRRLFGDLITSMRSRYEHVPLMVAYEKIMCYDTPGFTNGQGYGCSDYETRGWCASGAFTPGNGWTIGKAYLHPEQHCCICGGGAASLPPPSHPPRSPPAPPPLPHNTVHSSAVHFSAALDMALEDFTQVSEDEFKSALADTVGGGVTADDITLIVKDGSIIVDSTIKTTSKALASSISSTVEQMSADPALLTNALRSNAGSTLDGVNVDKISMPEVIDIEAPFRPPPSPSPPPAPGPPGWSKETPPSPAPPPPSPSPPFLPGWVFRPRQPPPPSPPPIWPDKGAWATDPTVTGMSPPLPPLAPPHPPPSLAEAAWYLQGVWLFLIIFMGVLVGAAAVICWIKRAMCFKSADADKPDQGEFDTSSGGQATESTPLAPGKSSAPLTFFNLKQREMLMGKPVTKPATAEPGEPVQEPDAQPLEPGWQHQQVRLGQEAASSEVSSEHTGSEAATRISIDSPLGAFSERLDQLRQQALDLQRRASETSSGAEPALTSPAVQAPSAASTPSSDSSTARKRFFGSRSATAASAPSSVSPTPRQRFFGSRQGSGSRSGTKVTRMNSLERAKNLHV